MNEQLYISAQSLNKGKAEERGENLPRMTPKKTVNSDEGPSAVGGSEAGQYGKRCQSASA